MPLTTHVLDLTSGAPAAGLAIRLVREGHEPISVITNTDGRADAPLLTELAVGLYRLEFEVGAYFRRTRAGLPEPAFLEVVVVDFGVADPRQHHHVPLLVSPFGYSTYRGS